ncbi:MAG: aminotransferase class III-fold pyridoxal phosphate-dependent enzyme [Alphaproteobacteria bacterium]|nr:MAG: aminotransferase class III-fold pyridoxal phosphate-dependent enzyme [Alphaproteobacteria bacterium]
MKDSNFLKEHNARSVWHPLGHPGRMREEPPRIITGASGVRIRDIDGHEGVDAVGGLWCVNLGFSCQPIKEAIAEQLDRLPYYSAFAGTTNDRAIELAEELRAFFEPDGLSRAFFTSGGSDSVDTALRLARQYHRIRGDGTRTKFISLRKGYHGTHFGGASVNGNPRFRTAYEPLLPGCFHIPAPHAYRNPFGEDDPARVAELCLKALEEEILFQDPSTVAAFIAEPILGAGGVIVPHESFYPGAAEICRRHGVLFIADEVITGFGRTGDWTGSRHWGVCPDLMTTAKGITNGYFPFGAVMIADHVAAVFEEDETGAATISHGYTYSCHPVGAAAALATLGELRRGNVTANAAARGTQLYEGARRLMERFEIIGDVRGGHGLMTAIELVRDRATREPVDEAVTKRVGQLTWQNGAMVRVSGNNILMSPPLIISAEEVDVVLGALEAAFAAL